MAPRVIAKAQAMIERLRYLVAIEMICATTAIELRGVVDVLGDGPRRLYEAVRELVAPLEDDRELGTDLEKLYRMMSGPCPIHEALRLAPDIALAATV